MVKRRFLISNVSAGNVTMCREQKLDREPRYDQAWSDTFTDTRVPLEAHTGFTALHFHLNTRLTVSQFFLWFSSLVLRNSFNGATFYFVIRLYSSLSFKAKIEFFITTVKSGKYSDVTHKRARKWLVHVLTASRQEHPIGYSVSGLGLCKEANETRFNL
jgi:hypothetical protein